MHKYRMWYHYMLRIDLYIHAAKYKSFSLFSHRILCLSAILVYRAQALNLVITNNIRLYDQADFSTQLSVQV